MGLTSVSEDLAEMVTQTVSSATPLPPRRTLTRALEVGLDQVSHLLQGRVAAIWLLRDQTLRLVASRPPRAFASPLVEVPLPASTPITVAVRSQQPVVALVDEATSWDVTGKMARWPESGALVALPLIPDEQVIGAIAYSVPDEARAREDVAQLATIVANGIALAIDNARLYAAAVRSQRELLGIIASSPTGIIVVEGGPRAGRVSFTNQTAERLLGVALPPGTSIADIARSVDIRDGRGETLPVEQWPPLRSLDGETCTNVTMQVYRTGEPVTWLLVDSVPLRDPQGAVVGAVATLQDVSALIESERRLQRYLSVIAHELRAPLTVLTGFAQLLQRQRKDRSPAEAKAIDAIRFNVARLDTMIRDLLDASRLQAHRLRIEPTALELAPLIRRTIDGLRPVIGDHPVQVEVADGVPPVWADPQRVAQIVTNLLTNAAKFSPLGAPITVHIEPSAEGACVSVTDRGPGIPEADLPRLFQPFQQLERPGYPREGLGLGLYITRGLVEAQGGRIGVATRVGQGSTFWFSLPRVQPQTVQTGVA